MYQTMIFIGRLGRDPEMRFSPKGEPVTSFSVAVDDGYGESKKTLWLRVSVWGKQAEACNQYLKKGKMVLVEGRMIADAATGGPRIFQKKDGTWAASFEVNASTVKFLGGKDEAEAGPEFVSDEVPF